MVSDIDKRYRGFYVMIRSGKEHLIVSLDFEDRWADQISVLRRGSALQVIGKISDITEHGAHLSACEIGH